jgi:hypothetical protein
MCGEDAMMPTMSKDVYIQQLESHIEELQEKSTLGDEYKTMLAALLPEWYEGPDMLSPNTNKEYDKPNTQHVFRSRICTFAVVREDKRTGKCLLMSYFMNGVEPMSGNIPSDIRSMKKYIEKQFENAMTYYCKPLVTTLIHTHVENILATT